MGISILFLLKDKTCNLKISDTKKVWVDNAHDLKKIKEKINLTSDVHRNAFFVAKKSLIATNFIGLGLDNYAVGHKYFRNRSVEVLSDPLASILNERDASSNLIKIFTEFGIFTFFPIALFLYFIFRSKEDLYTSIFLIAVVLTQLIRGAGYFNGGFILFSLMICHSVFVSQKSKND